MILDIIITIYIAILLLLSCINFFRILKWRKFNIDSNYKRYETECYIEKKWSILSQIIGYIGKGKSSFANGLAHVLERILIRKKEKKIEETTLIFLHEDFNKLNDYLYNVFSEGTTLIQMIDRVDELTDLFIYHDFLNCVSSHVQMEKYLTAFYYTYIDNNMILAKDKIYSHNTCQNCNVLEEDALKLIDGYENGSWTIHDYQIIIRDENSLTRGSAQSNDAIIKTDSVKQLFQLFRNIFEGTSYFINIQQTADDAVAQERRLFGTNFLVEDREEIVVCGFLTRLLTKKYVKRIKWYYFKTWFKRKFLKFDIVKASLEPNSVLRTQRASIKIINDFLFSIGDIVYSGKHYFNCKNVGSTDEKTFDACEFWLPTDEVYGPSETHAYRIWKFLLMRRSKKRSTPFKNKRKMAEAEIKAICSNKKEDK